MDLKTGERWTVRPNAGPIPWWIFSGQRRVPGSRASDYLEALRLARAKDDTTVGACVSRDSGLYERFWEPFTEAVLNTSVEEGAAVLLWSVLAQTFGRGEAACRPRIVRSGLSRAFVDPAVAFLEERGCPVHLRRRLRGSRLEADRITALEFTDGAVDIAPGQSVIMAVPPSAAAALVPGLVAPRGNRAIVNAHFRLSESRDDVTFVGVIGGLSHWVFVRGDVASVTISAADHLAADPARDIAARLWPEVARALDLGDAAQPECRVFKEKRATFAQTPVEVARRPKTRTSWENLFLAGDWTDTRLPATIEGAILSGGKAAEEVAEASANT